MITMFLVIVIIGLGIIAAGIAVGIVGAIITLSPVILFIVFFVLIDYAMFKIVFRRKK